jgi:2'-5' RNA ligase
MPETETKRLFVGIFPPAHVVASLKTAVADLVEGIPVRAVRWIPTSQVHLTLDFLGSIEITRILAIASSLKGACVGQRQCKVRVAGLGCFPNPSQPRIIWAGLAGDLRPLQNLKESIDARFLACGCVCEDRPFHPHLTVGRVRDSNPTGRGQVSAALAKEKDRAFGEWQVERIDLVQSVLSAKGTAYETLNSVLLENR